MAGAGIIDVETELSGMRTMVTDLVDKVAHMNRDLQSVMQLMATSDGGVYGETYATDRGPAVRALFFEQQVRANDETTRRTNMLSDQMAGLEATIAELNGIQTTYHGSVDTLMSNTTRLENELRDVSGRIGASLLSANLSTGGRMNVTGMKGFEKLRNCGGDAAHWKDLRFNVTTWLEIENWSFETLVRKLDRSENEPQEPEVGQRMKVGATELTSEEEWCGEELYHMLVQKCEGSALAIVRKQNTQGRARGLIAWYRTLRDAEGQIETKRTEVTEKVFYSGRKAVAAKDVVATIATWEEELREYTMLTGLEVDNTLKLLNLKRILPEEIEEMLQTVEITEYPWRRSMPSSRQGLSRRRKAGKPSRWTSTRTKKRRRRSTSRSRPRKRRSPTQRMNSSLGWAKGLARAARPKGARAARERRQAPSGETATTAGSMGTGSTSARRRIPT